MNWMMIDMNSYFASAEQYFRPELRGRPVGVIPVETDSTCIIAASYDAKRCGVKVGTGVRDALRLCPGIVLVQARPKLYVQMHHRLLQSVKQCAPICRVYSIDEWTIQLRGGDRDPAQARRLAQDIKRQLRDDFGPWLTCSIGIAPTRLLAKIASNLQKPDGLTLLSVADLPGRLEHLSLTDLTGISHGLLARLNQQGVHTIRDLWNADRDGAIRLWGSISGADWWAGFHGHDEPEIPTRRRSMSHGKVLEPELRNPAGALGTLTRLTCKLGYRLRESEYLARSLRISLQHGPGHGGGYADEVALPAVQDTTTLLQQLRVLWERRPPNSQPIKKVDVCVAGLVRASQVSRPLFDDLEKLQRLSQAMDKINDRLGSLAVYFGSVHHYRQPLENKIAFGRIPHELD